MSPVVAVSSVEPVAATTSSASAHSAGSIPSAIPSANPSGNVPTGLPPRSLDRHHQHAATNSGVRNLAATSSGLSSSHSSAVAAGAAKPSTAGAAPGVARQPSPAPLQSSSTPPSPTPPPPPARRMSGPPEMIATSSDGVSASSAAEPGAASVTPGVGGASISGDSNRASDREQSTRDVGHVCPAPASTLKPAVEAPLSDGLLLESNSKLPSDPLPSDTLSAKEESSLPGTSPALDNRISKDLLTPTNGAPLAGTPPLEASVPASHDTQGGAKDGDQEDDDDEEEAELPGEESTHRRRGAPSTTSTRSDAPVEFDAFLSTISSMAEIQRYKVRRWLN